jgi:coenzyme F420-reducing hydrogenase delta subunit
MNAPSLSKTTVFHCINVFSDGDTLTLDQGLSINPKFVRLPCSSMVKDVFLLRAFEAGADAVVVLVCPEGACRYVEGNLRAKKRVAWIKALLDEIGIGGDRLTLFNVASGDTAAVERILRETESTVATLGPSPANVVNHGNRMSSSDRREEKKLGS